MTHATSGVDYVDMNRMASVMKIEIDNSESSYDHIANRSCTIHKVPEHIRELGRSSYEPIVLSVGPYHHGIQAALSMEKEKWRSLDFILKLNCKVSLQDYIKVVAELETRARNCYSEEIEMSRKQFVQMLLLDASFILVKVDGTIRNAMPNASSRRWNAAEGSERIAVQDSGATRDRVSCSGTNTGNTSVENVNPDEITGDWYSNCAWHDLFLLENQIPFFVMSSIYKLAVGQSTVQVFEDTIAECVADILRHFPKAVQNTHASKNAHHFLHLSHMYLRPSQTMKVEQMRFYRLFQFRNEAEETRQRLLPLPTQQMDCFRAGTMPSTWRRATQYHEAGIRLQKREYTNNSTFSLLDITVRNGVLEFPCFPIDENTESFFKNLIAFEQRDPSFGDDITAYIMFMSHLARNTDDMSLLVQKGIIVHMLDSDEEVSAMFVRLTKEVTFFSENEYYLKPLCLALEAHYESRINRWVAWLWLNHFSNPWLALAVFGTTIMIVCTVVQTVYTILAYVKPPA